MIYESDKPFKNSEVCQKCANCCKISRIFVKNKGEAQRFNWLDTDLIKVIKISDNLWKVIFNIPCKKLLFQNNKYYCTAYNSNQRPKLCKDYPNNFLHNSLFNALENEKNTCILIKNNIDNYKIPKNEIL